DAPTVRMAERGITPRGVCGSGAATTFETGRTGICSDVAGPKGSCKFQRAKSGRCDGQERNRSGGDWQILWSLRRRSRGRSGNGPVAKMIDLRGRNCRTCAFLPIGTFRQNFSFDWVPVGRKIAKVSVI